jgi:hypothetical protein
LSDRLNPWLTLGGSLVSVLVVAFVFFNPIGEVDLTVRIDQEVQASLPSRAVENLQLVFNGQAIDRASIITVEIENSGRRRIGANNEPWTVNLRSTDGSAVVPLGVPRPIPTSRTVSVSKGSTPDVATVTFGLFNRGDRVVLDLLLINPTTDGGLPIRAETNVPDLGEPVTGRRNVRERLRDAFTPPLLVVSFIGLGSLMIRERRQLQRKELPLAPAHTFPVGVLYVLMGAVFITLAAANGLAWIAARILARS